jgi:hypothetical protein
MNTNPHNAMNSTPNSDSGHDCGPYSGDDTLRLIAGLPAPAGLEERVHKALRAGPRGRVLGSGRVLSWPVRFCAKTTLESNWVRAAAAAAIVFVVVGGGWGVYSRVQPAPAGKVIVMPQIVPSSGGFSGAGAIRVPATIPGPKIRDHGTTGPSHPGREQETQTAKKPAAPKKSATSQHPASAPMQQPAASQ